MKNNHDMSLQREDDKLKHRLRNKDTSQLHKLLMTQPSIHPDLFQTVLVILYLICRPKLLDTDQTSRFVPEHYGSFTEPERTNKSTMGKENCSCC